MNYLTTHLKEAIEINQDRAPLYAELTNGESNRISNALLQSEKLSLATSIPMDKTARYWQKRGVPVFVYEFIPMNQTPQFTEKFSDMDGITADFPHFPTGQLIDDLLKYLKSDDYAKVSSLTGRALKDLSATPKHLCLVRHLVESIHRGSNLLPLHLEKTKEKNLFFSPKKLCHYLLWAQTVAIRPSVRIDSWAHPIQRRGIPIIYQDVPYIPPMPKKYT